MAFCLLEANITSACRQSTDDIVGATSGEGTARHMSPFRVITFNISLTWHIQIAVVIVELISWYADKRCVFESESKMPGNSWCQQWTGQKRSWGLGVTSFTGEASGGDLIMKNGQQDQFEENTGRINEVNVLLFKLDGASWFPYHTGPSSAFSDLFYDTVVCHYDQYLRPSDGHAYQYGNCCNCRDLSPEPLSPLLVAFEPLEYPREEDSHAYSVTTKEELLDWVKNGDQTYRDLLVPLSAISRTPTSSSSFLTSVSLSPPFGLKPQQTGP
ncbi:hypothetical protein EDB85DRAFT_1900613 [Lactarius pseudohatsudake]|nr:hypothetical protein EDB85DRAFT_1900613 [Lactarius pseudohatsudake]